MTKDALNHLVDTASQKGITLTCKEMKSALLYSDHKMYKKLKIGTDIRKLKILPTNGGKFYSSSYAGSGIEFPCRPKPIETEFTWRIGRITAATTSTRPCDTTSDEKKCGRRRTVAERRCSPDYGVMKLDG